MAEEQEWKLPWKLVEARRKYLVKEFIPVELLDQLRNVLTEPDMEQVKADESNHGPIKAAATLIDRLRRKGPDAFPTFVDALRKAGFAQAAQILDPKYDMKDRPRNGCGSAELVCIDGVVTDIRIEVSLKKTNGEEAVDVGESIKELYDSPKLPEIRELRSQFMQRLDEDMKRFLTFVKITKTDDCPLVLIFRLSAVTAAEKLLKICESGELGTMIKECLSTVSGTKNIFENDDLVIDVNINEDNYEKVLKTLTGSKYVAVIDGEEKRELVLKDFQKGLAAPALEGKNTVVCAPTGSGKTFVAMKVIKKYLVLNGERKMVFIVNSVSLVQQQLQCLETYLPEGVRVSSLCGNINETLSDVLKDSDVVVLTAQVLVNSLKKQDTSISKFSLLVFDECHHTKGRTPYNEIMLLYMKAKFEGPNSTCLPQILGLSASLGIGTGNSGWSTKAEQHILDICANLDAQILRVSTVSLQGTGTVVIPVSQENNGAFQNAVNEAMEKIEVMCPSFENIPRPRGSQPYENWVVDLQKQKLGRDLMTCAEHLNSYNNALVLHEETRTKDALCYQKKIANSIESKDPTPVEVELNKIYETVKAAVSSEQQQGGEPLNPKLQKLEEILLKKFSNDGTAKGIVFVRTRLVARALVEWIKDSQNPEEIKATHLVGCAKDGMSKCQQDEEIRRFRDGAYNVIVATSAILEGIDVPDCNFVINYGMPGNEITHVQARGRVRNRKTGDYTIIVSNDQKSLKERDLGKEKIMNEAITKVESMKEEEFQKEVNRLQQQAYKEHQKRIEQEGMDEKKPMTDGIKLHCKKCDVFACEAKHLRVFCGAHHLVLHYKETLKSVKIQESSAGKNINMSLVKTHNLLCEKCSQKWGNLSKNQHGEFPCIKISNFRVKVEDESKGQVFKTWKDFPYKIQIFDESECMNMASES